jgi:hypothetical protein
MAPPMIEGISDRFDRNFLPFGIPCVILSRPFVEENVSPGYEDGHYGTTIPITL